MPSPQSAGWRAVRKDAGLGMMRFTTSATPWPAKPLCRARTCPWSESCSGTASIERGRCTPLSGVFHGLNCSTRDEAIVSKGDKCNTAPCEQETSDRRVAIGPPDARRALPLKRRSG